MFWQRLLTAAVGIPLTVWIMVKGSWVLALAVGFIVGLGLSELTDILSRIANIKLSSFFVVCGGLLIVAGAYIGGDSWGLSVTVVVLAVLVIFGLRPGHGLVKQVGPLFLAWLYWGFLPSHIILLRASGQGLSWLLVAVSCTWATDIGAYLIGSAWGRHKLAPAISPHKSVEGALGGLLSSVAVALVLGRLLNLPMGVLWWMGAVIAFSGEVGDLVESAVKREANIKDSGRLLPGHGGILDRFDSLVFVVPVVYYLVTWLQ